MKEGLRFNSLMEILGGLAKKYPEGSEEFQAIELASKAMLFAHQRDTYKKFLEFIGSFDAELTEEQKKQLNKMGLED